MRIFAIVGSGRDGNNLQLTEDIINRIERYAKADGQDFKADLLKLRQLQLPFCTSCHNCVTEKGESYCPHASVVAEVREKLEEADGIILASPVSSMQVTGLMKNCIDHFSFYYHRPCLFNKYGLALTNTAGAGHKATGKYLQSVMHAWGISKPQVLPLKLASLQVVKDKKMERKLERAARKLYLEITQQRTYRPSLFDVIYYSVWRALISTYAPGEADYDYWHGRGWLEQNYYTPNPGLLKGAIGGMIFRILRRSFAEDAKGDKTGEV